MISKKFLLCVTIIFLIQMNIARAESEYRRIIVMPSNATYKIESYDVETWNTKYNQIMEIVSTQAKVNRNSPGYNYVALSIPSSEYNQTFEELNKSGYYVRDEIIQKIQLNESLPIINAPYTPRGRSTLTGAGRLIAIVDGGIDCTHPDINDCDADHSGKLYDWHNTFDVTNSTIFDDEGHGTHVASIIAGTGAASSGKFRGVAPSASLMIIKACDKDALCPTTNQVAALEYIQYFGNSHNKWPDAVSMSIGTEITNTDDYMKYCSGKYGGEVTEEYDLIINLTKKGVVVVAAAGNEGVHPKSINFPACMNKTIAVGFIYKNNDASYCNYLDFGNKTFCQDLTDGTEGYYKDTRFHAIVNVSGGYNSNYEKEWIAPYTEHATGFQQTFFITSPTTVRIRAEGLWKKVDWWGIFPCAGYYEGWDPGTDQKGDQYWEWSQTINPLPAGNWVVLEVAARPYFSGKSWLGCYWTGWDRSDGVTNKSDNIIVRIFPTLDGFTKNLFFRTARGPNPYGLIKPDVVAPGMSICGAKAAGVGEQDKMVCGNDNYIAMSGSSASTPFVAGVVALLKEYRSTSSYDEIVKSLKSSYTGTDFPDPSREGSGILNVKNSVECLGDPFCRSSGNGGGSVCIGRKSPFGPPSIC